MLKALYLCLVVPLVLSQTWTVPQNWVDNRTPSCANIETLITFSDGALDTINARIVGIRNVLPQLQGDYNNLNCAVATKSSIQNLIQADDYQAQPLIDDSTQKTYFKLDQFNSEWNSKSVSAVCSDVKTRLGELISYFQWLGPNLKSYYLDNYLPDRLTNLYVYENQCICRGSPNICIIGATWGTKDVTPTIKGLVNSNGLSVRAQENPLPTGGRPSNYYQRSLVVVYQIGNNKPKVMVVAEGATLTISNNDPNQNSWVGPVNGALNIFGAAFGLGDVTAKVASLVYNNQVSVNPSTKTFGETWPGQQKTFTVVYKNSRGAIKTLDVVEVYDGSKILIS